MQYDEEYIDLEEETGQKPKTKGRLTGFLDGKLFVPVIIILVSIIGFSLGRISGIQERREPVKVYNSPTNLPSATVNNGEVKGASIETTTSESGEVVASKNGSKYHYPWCAGAKQISEKNKISFPSIEAARASGYTPAANCKGLE